MQTTHGIFLLTYDCKYILMVHPTNHAHKFRSIPKGLGEEGESSLESAFREMEEETSLYLNDIFIQNKVDLYVDLGIATYENKVKQLHAHLVVLNMSTSINLISCHLECTSTFIDRTMGEELPENDKIEWLDYESLRFYELHHAQKNFMEKIDSYLELIKKRDIFDTNKLKNYHGE